MAEKSKIPLRVLVHAKLDTTAPKAAETLCVRPKYSQINLAHSMRMDYRMRIDVITNVMITRIATLATKMAPNVFARAGRPSVKWFQQDRMQMGHLARKQEPT